MGSICLPPEWSEDGGAENLWGVEEALLRLGIAPNYIGFWQAVYAIGLSVRQPEAMLMVDKWLYQEVAERFGTNHKAVERNIRTVVERIWKAEPAYLDEIPGFERDRKPKNAQFLSILALYLTRPAERRKMESGRA